MRSDMGVGFRTRPRPPSNAPRLSCAAPAGGRDDLVCGAHRYVGTQMEFCQDRAAAASTAG